MMYPNTVDFGGKGTAHAVLFHSVSKLLNQSGRFQRSDARRGHSNRQLRGHISGPEDILTGVFGIFRRRQQFL